jgi:hypothetical protein
MRALLVLAITIPVLLAFGAACGGDEDEARLIPSPAGESGGEAEEAEVAEEPGAEETIDVEEAEEPDEAEAAADRCPHEDAD